MDGISKHFYQHVARFKAGGDAPQGGVLVDFLQTLLPSVVVGSAVLAVLFFYQDETMIVEYDLSFAETGLCRFLLRLAVMRIAVDVTFFAAHYALHAKALFAKIHACHHEHRSPHVWTNYHFTAADLVLEGFLPFAVGLVCLAWLGLTLSRFELQLLFSHIMWYEIGSHCGKPIPVLSVFPPLAPVYRAVMGNVDKNNVWFHHCHHAHRGGNYGITPWLDAVLGTGNKHTAPGA